MSALVASPKLEITRTVYLNTRDSCMVTNWRYSMPKTDRPEAAHIADQLRRAFSGDAWHGDSVFEILEGVNAAQAAAHPIKKAHSIWELVLHIAAWDGAVLQRLGGAAVELSDAQNFPAVTDASRPHGARRWPRCDGSTRHWSRPLRLFRTRGLTRSFRAKKARTTPSTTCFMAWCSMSCIMPGRLRC